MAITELVVMAAMAAATADNSLIEHTPAVSIALNVVDIVPSDIRGSVLLDCTHLTGGTCGRSLWLDNCRRHEFYCSFDINSDQWMCAALEKVVTPVVKSRCQNLTLATKELRLTACGHSSVTMAVRAAYREVC